MSWPVPPDGTRKRGSILRRSGKEESAPGDGARNETRRVKSMGIGEVLLHCEVIGRGFCRTRDWQHSAIRMSNWAPRPQRVLC